jgi:hypothetical protein
MILTIRSEAMDIPTILGVAAAVTSILNYIENHNKKRPILKKLSTVCHITVKEIAI